MTTESFTMPISVGTAERMENTRLKPSTGLSRCQLMSSASGAVRKRV